MSRIWARRDQLGIPLSYRIEMPDAGTAHAFFSLSDGNFMELVAPRGEGITGYTGCWRGPSKSIGQIAEIGVRVAAQ